MKQITYTITQRIGTSGTKRRTVSGYPLDNPYGFLVAINKPAPGQDWAVTELTTGLSIPLPSARTRELARAGFIELVERMTPEKIHQTIAYQIARSTR